MIDTSNTFNSFEKYTQSNNGYLRSGQSARKPESDTMPIDSRNNRMKGGKSKSSSLLLSNLASPQEHYVVYVTLGLKMP